MTAVKFKANYFKVFVHIQSSKTDQDKKNVSLAIDKIGGIKRLFFIGGGGSSYIYQFSPLLERKKTVYRAQVEYSNFRLYPDNNPLILTYIIILTCFCNFKY